MIVNRAAALFWHPYPPRTDLNVPRQEGTLVPILFEVVVPSRKRNLDSRTCHVT